MKTSLESYQRAQWIFLRVLGLIYGIAFASLWVQIEGLLGANGILPAKDFLGAVRLSMGWERYWWIPTLLWLNASDVALNFLCAGGVLVSLVLIVGRAPVVALALLWLFYLSLASVAQDFLSFQWDVLLLETGFLAIFLAPLSLRSEEGPPPSKIVLWLLRWLLFRLIFSSGLVKLASGDPTWWSCTALTYHYQTQPLPTWIGWYAHQLPAWFQRLSCGVMFAIELGVPFLIFAPCLLRRIGCVALVAFQGLIALTGNYCFFNLLTIALCLFLIDDAAWPSKRHQAKEVEKEGKGWPRWVLIPLASVILLLSSLQMVGAFRRPGRLSRFVTEALDLVAPFRSVNSYGLFAVMTTSRPEIIVEGSRDGQAWVPYEFKYKPGDVKRRPGFVAPHQPRLDWQMWFAALGRPLDNPWFLSFCQRLLEGSPKVLGLIKKNPFPEGSARYVRAVVYDYRFTDLSSHRATGAWWRREYKGLYVPPLSLKRKEAKAQGGIEGKAPVHGFSPLGDWDA